MTATLPPCAIPAQCQATPLAAWHQAHGGKLVDFAGWWMPLQYGKVMDEHHAVRQAAGLFDIGHMGLLCLDGDAATVLNALDGLVPQAVSALSPGKAIYTQLLNTQGGILDDLIIYHLPETGLGGAARPTDFSPILLIVNASNTASDIEWLQAHLPPSVTLRPMREQWTLWALQGPKFQQVLATLGISSDHLPSRFGVSPQTLTLNGQTLETVLCRTGYTGEDGIEWIVPQSVTVALWDATLAAGKAIGLLPVGLAARDTLRLEAAYPLHGHDIDPTVSPLEAGLSWSVKLDKPGDFIGKTALVAEKSTGVPRKTVCLKLLAKAIARQHDTIMVNDTVIGEVTSGSISPTLGDPIAMGLIDTTKAVSPDGVALKTGDTVTVMVRGKAIPAVIFPRPFYKGV